jgi:hypothetical protein
VTGNIQANITAVGTLTLLNVAGNVLAQTFAGNVVGNVTGNVVGNVVGNVTGNVTGNISVSGANTQVLFNDNGIANATAGMTFNKTTNNFSIGNTIICAIVSSGSVAANSINITELVRGNVLLANSGIIGVPSGTSTLFLGNTVSNTVFFGGNASNIYMANVNSTTTIAGNVTAGGNIVTGGSITATGNVTGGNIVTGGSITATGNVTGGNIVTSGSITATGNINLSGNLSAGGNTVLSGNLSAGGNTVLSGNATAATAANGTSTTQIATTAFVADAIVNRIPAGVITLWFGSIISIPAGWALCNGASGTPDLRNRFIVGAGSTYAVDAVGGSANAVVVDHTHLATSGVSDPGHAHSYTSPSGTDNGGISGGSVVDTTVSSTTGTAFTGITVATTVANAGSSGTNANLPPYYALAYIMKL